MASLGRRHQFDGTPLEIIQLCIKELEPANPGHEFEYDAKYFESPPQGS